MYFKESNQQFDSEELLNDFKKALLDTLDFLDHVSEFVSKGKFSFYSSSHNFTNIIRNVIDAICLEIEYYNNSDRSSLVTYMDNINNTKETIHNIINKETNKINPIFIREFNEFFNGKDTTIRHMEIIKRCIKVLGEIANSPRSMDIDEIEDFMREEFLEDIGFPTEIDTLQLRWLPVDFYGHGDYFNDNYYTENDKSAKMALHYVVVVKYPVRRSMAHKDIVKFQDSIREYFTEKENLFNVIDLRMDGGVMFSGPKKNSTGYFNFYLTDLGL